VSATLASETPPTGKASGNQTAPSTVHVALLTSRGNVTLRCGTVEPSKQFIAEIVRCSPMATVPFAALVPKDSTKAQQFLVDHPHADGRGIVVAILDTGVGEFVTRC